MISQILRHYRGSHNFNPENLQIARELRRLKKNELARFIGVSPSAITQFENGQARPTEQNVAQLSLVLRFPKSFFTRPDGGIRITTDNCHFRSLRSCSQIERRKMASATTLVGILIDFFEEQGIRFPAEQVSQFHFRDSLDDFEIEDAASRVREAWGLGRGPIGNLMALLESRGILLFEIYEECKELDAFSAWYKMYPLICLNNEKDSTSRARFNAAHELGHLILHTECLPGNRLHEDQANYFASCFLMPRETFEKECPRRLVWDHFIALKSRWGVSLAAMVRRAYDLGILSSDTYRRANVNLGKLGWRRSEPAEPPYEDPTLLHQCMDFLQDKGMSIDEITDVVGISKKDLIWLTSYGRHS